MFEHFLIGKFPRQQNPRQYYPEKCDDPVAERWADWGVVGSRIEAKKTSHTDGWGRKSTCSTNRSRRKGLRENRGVGGWKRLSVKLMNKLTEQWMEICSFFWISIWFSHYRNAEVPCSRDIFLKSFAIQVRGILLLCFVDFWVKKFDTAKLFWNTKLSCTPPPKKKLTRNPKN